MQTDAFLQDIPKLRSWTSVPLAAGEEWGARWDFNRLVENHDLDFVRCSLPNVGGITELIRICALCETGPNRPTYYRPDGSQITW